MLGLVFPGTSNPFFGEYADVLYEEASLAGFALLTACSAGNVEAELKLLDELALRDVDAILDATTLSADHVTQLPRPGVPTVFINCPFAIPGHHTIGPDAAGGARAMVEHLILEHGHRSVDHIGGGHDNTTARHHGWADAHHAHGRPPGETVQASFTSDGGYEAMQTLLRRPTPPTAIFVSSDRQALGALRAIYQAGLRVPHDIAVTSFDGIDETRFTSPPLTLARQPLRAMARAAIAATVDNDPPRHTLFTMEQVIRQSCGCP